MTKKMIRVMMGDGSKWDVPLHIAAESCAMHWTNKAYPPALSTRSKWDEAYGREYEFAMSQADITMDWAVNNMDWNDVAKHAVRVNPSRPADYQQGWVNGEKEVVEVEA